MEILGESTHGYQKFFTFFKIGAGVCVWQDPVLLELPPSQITIHHQDLNPYIKTSIWHYCWMGGLDPTYATPPKTNMDTQDDGLEKVLYNSF